MVGEAMSSFRRFLSRPFGWLIAVAGFLCLAVPLAWATLAIYYSNLQWASARIGLAAAFAAFAIWALWFSRQRRMFVSAVVLFFGVVAWWISIRPSHDRNWRPEVAVMPRATIDGDHVHLTGVRNFQYRSRNDFTVGYQERDVLLSHLVALDFFVSYFTEGPVGHTFLSFIFDNAPPLSISIETRPEVGEGFAPVASLFKQFELVYLARINELADHPEFYHLLTDAVEKYPVSTGFAVGRAFFVLFLARGLSPVANTTLGLPCGSRKRCAHSTCWWAE
jgi:Domain of unknown function (DUF4105)